jgi:hypothetical protein
VNLLAYADPWGNCAQSATRWAYALLASAGGVPCVLGNLRTGSRPRAELNRLDLRAQAAQIRGIVESIAVENPVAAAYLAAFYLPKPLKERQAGGGITFVDYFGAERKKAIEAVAKWLMVQGEGSRVYHIRGYIHIVSDYCLGPKIMRVIRRYGEGYGSIDTLARLLKIDNNAVGEVRATCREALADLDRLAHYLADDRLARAGLIT